MLGAAEIKMDRGSARNRCLGLRLRTMATFLACVLLHFAAPADAASSRTRTVEKSAARHSPSGPLQIVVSLSQQRLTVFDAGVPIMSSAVSSGQSGYDTPAGIYTILQKNRFHESNIYSGAPMPFMQRITWSGIALHEGNLPGYAASHGCIRLPGAFASSLFGVTKVGARVIVAREPLMPMPIEHDKLFRPEQPSTPVAIAPSSGPATMVDPNAAQSNVAGGFLVGSAAAATSAGSAAPADNPPNAPASSDRQTIPEAPATASRADRARAKAQTESLVSVLVSRQTGRIYVRQNFEPLHEAPITIQDADLPLGTHLFTAIAYNGDKTRLSWNVVSYPMVQKVADAAPRGRLTDAERADAAAGIKRSWITPPGAALERIEFGEDIMEMLSEVARPGMSLIVTDKGPGPETGKGTEFVVQPR